MTSSLIFTEPISIFICVCAKFHDFILILSKKIVTREVIIALINPTVDDEGLMLTLYMPVVDIHVAIAESPRI